MNRVTSRESIGEHSQTGGFLGVEFNLDGFN